MKNHENTYPIKFSFLCLAGRLHENFDTISAEIRKKVTGVFSQNKIIPEENGKIHDHEGWYTWNWIDKILFDGSSKDCDIKIKHYKVRLIIEITIEVTLKHGNDEFIELFKEARRFRTVLENIPIVKEILVPIPDHIERFYSFPFIQICKEYQYHDDFKHLKNESITSFFYEVHDAKRENFRSIFFQPKTTLIRVSRPSIITTESSEFMRAEIINAIYDTCLHSLRKNKVTTPSDKIFRVMRDYIGRVLFTHEETVAGADLNRAVHSISIIAIFGVLSSTIALIAVIGWDLSLTGIKSLFGLFLFIATVVVLVIILVNRSSIKNWLRKNWHF